MLIEIKIQWQKWTQDDEGFPMVYISFHIYVWIYSGSSRSKQAMASWDQSLVSINRGLVITRLIIMNLPKFTN